MKQRCDYAGSENYHLYGGRGITYDPQWSHYLNFLADMGRRPPGTTLDRLDSNGNYTKDNCRWATRAQQNNNRRNTRMITAFGETKTITDWSLELSIPAQRIRDRYTHGWRGEACFTTHKRGRFGRDNQKLNAPPL